MRQWVVDKSCFDLPFSAKDLRYFLVDCLPVGDEVCFSNMRISIGLQHYIWIDCDLVSIDSVAGRIPLIEKFMMIHFKGRGIPYASGTKVVFVCEGHMNMS